MMEYPRFSRLTATVLERQHEWLIRKSIETALPKSALLREAIELLIAKHEREAKT